MKILRKKEVNIASRWVGTKARDVDVYKLWYSGGLRGKNGVGILVKKELKELVVDLRRMNNMLMAIKLVVGGLTLIVVSAYTPQAGLYEEVKRHF